MGRRAALDAISPGQSKNQIIHLPFLRCEWAQQATADQQKKKSGTLPQRPKGLSGAIFFFFPFQISSFGAVSLAATQHSTFREPSP